MRPYKNAYWCGANASIFLDGVLLDEGVSIQYKLMQNKLPLYGYNVPEFSAIADGQVIVNGVLLVNYVSHEYLLAAIRTAAGFLTSPAVENPKTNSNNTLAGANQEVILFAEPDPLVTAALKLKYWGQGGVQTSQGQYNTDIKSNFGRPDQHNKSFEIIAKYGDPNSNYFTQHILKHVTFLGRSLSTTITEDPMIEAFDFIARSIV